MSLIKTPKQINIMRENGKRLGEILSTLSRDIKPGIAALELEQTFLNFCNKHGFTPSCKGYTAEGFMPPFPTGLCVSVNSQSVHCFPKKGQILKEGDLVTIDTVIEKNGMHVDASFAKGVGKTSEKVKNLLETSKGALSETTKRVKQGIKIGELSHTMYRFVKAKGFDVLRDYAGHGIGESMHEPPEVACYGDPHQGMSLISGMTICIESLVCEGKPNVQSVSAWETKMRDNKYFLQFENTVLVTNSGYEILTPLEV